jgi:hypothetical protein
MPVNWASIAAQLGSVGLTNLSKEAIQHGADAARRDKEELRYKEEMERKLAELTKRPRPQE